MLLMSLYFFGSQQECHKYPDRITTFCTGFSIIKVFKSFCINTRNAHATIASISRIFRTVVEFTDPSALFLADLHANAPNTSTGPVTNILEF